MRRFWQGSPDHRGTPEAPGRVATLIQQAEASCVGRAFRLSDDVFREVLGQLDHREKEGFERHTLNVQLADGRRIDALTYIATPTNASFLGPAPVAEMAAHIARSQGPSGPNDEYLLQLACWLDEHDIHDAHIQELVAALRAL